MNNASTSQTSKAIVTAFWQAMQTNDYAKASEWLAEDVICDWVLSGERIVGRENFTAINANYPTKGKRQFDLRRIIADGDQVVTDVMVSDGVVSAIAVTFHTVKNGVITQQIEYWPESYPAPDWRKQWVTDVSPS